MFTTWIGIDPGLKGGIAAQHTNRPIQVAAMPVTDGVLDTLKLSDIIEDMLDGGGMYRPALVCIEGVGAMPGQGVSSTFKFGFVTGIAHGVLAAKGIVPVIVYPLRWKNRVLSGTDKSKQAAIDYCRLHFPDINLLATQRSRKPSDGIADALCLSEYARHFHSVNKAYKSIDIRKGKHGGGSGVPA